MDTDDISNVATKMGSVERFGYEWARYSELDPNYEVQFRKWVAPLEPSFFAGKKVLDAGCGMGRNSYWPLKYGAKEVVAFDFDKRTVEAAKRTLREFKNAHVEIADIYSIPYENEFDIAFSIGVIHHLEKPELAIQNLVKAVKSGGTVLIWVYGYEGNEWIVKYLSSIRKVITSKLPSGLLHFLTYFISVPFFAFVKLIPTKNSYLAQLKKFKFKHVHSIIFDQLLPQIANYWTQEEAKSLLLSANLKDVEIHNCNNNSWTVMGRK